MKIPKGSGRSRIVSTALLAVWLQVSGIQSVDALEYLADVTESGERFILVEGAFEIDSDVDEFINLAISYDPAFVVFNSTGGNVQAALSLGRAIRRLGLDTIQTRFLECASACAFAFMGGVDRFAEPGSIGVHRSSMGMPATNLDPDLAVSAVQLHTAEVIGYLLEMGVDPGLLQLALQYDATDMRYLSASEMELFRVSSDPTTIEKMKDSRTLGPTMGQSEIATSQALAENGIVHHPQGGAPVKLRPQESEVEIAFLSNGTRIEITGIADNWYRIETGSILGWMERSWLAIDGFIGGHSEERYIQVASTSNLDNAWEYVRQFGRKLWIFETSTGWYALTLPRTFTRTDASAMIMELKNAGSIPQDSFFHYGNTFIRRVCCE